MNGNVSGEEAYKKLLDLDYKNVPHFFSAVYMAHRPDLGKILEVHMHRVVMHIEKVNGDYIAFTPRVNLRKSSLGITTGEDGVEYESNLCFHNSVISTRHLDGYKLIYDEVKELDEYNGDNPDGRKLVVEDIIILKEAFLSDLQKVIAIEEPEYIF